MIKVRVEGGRQTLPGVEAEAAPGFTASAGRMVAGRRSSVSPLGLTSQRQSVSGDAGLKNKKQLHFKILQTLITTSDSLSTSIILLGSEGVTLIRLVCK